MIFIIKLAFRNLSRYKKRTFITAVIIAMAVFIFILSDSLMLGIEEISYQNIINLETGHLQLMKAEFKEKEEELPLEQLYASDEEIFTRVKQIEGVESLSPELKFSTNLNNGIDELPVTGLGVKSENLEKVYTVKKYLVQGRWFHPEKSEAVLGKDLADLMDLTTGDYATLLIKDIDGTFNTIEAEISGLISTPNPEINKNIIFVPLTRAQESLNVDNKISHISVRMKNRGMAFTGVDKINSSNFFQNLELTAYSWRETAEFIVAMGKSQRIENYVILGIILIIAAVGIVNTIILSALERLEEIGMMKALGLRQKEIVFEFMLEAVIIGIIGGLIGCGAGAVGVSLLNTYGISLDVFGGGATNYGIPIMDRIYGAWNIEAFVFVFAFGIIVSFLASILPAWWAARKDPVKAIYHR